MSDERIDVVLNDNVSEGPANKLRELANQAKSAHTEIGSLKASLKTFDVAALRKFNQEQVRSAVSQARVETARERQRAATARADAATQGLAAATGKATRAQQQAALAAARVVTEQERTAKAAVLTQRAQEAGTAAIQRHSRAVEQAGDAAVKSYRRQADEAERARNKINAANSQAQFNTVLGVGRAPGNSARASAGVFAEADREAKKAAQSAAALERATLKAAGGQKALATATGLTRFQVLTLQYTVNDVIASLASGANPFTILAQQGGQVTQAWGGLIPTLKAAGGAIFSLTGAVVATVAAGVGWLVFIDQANAELKGFQKQLDLTNGSAGLTSDAFLAMGNDIAAASKTSISSSRDIALGLSRTGQLQKQQIFELGVVTQNFAKLSGQSTDEVLKQFAKMTDAPGKLAREFTTQYNILSVPQYEHIRRLEEEGRKTEAVTALSRALYSYYANEAPRSLSTVGSYWSRLTLLISDSITKLKNWGAEAGIAQKKAGIQARIIQLQEMATLPGAQRQAYAVKELAIENEKLTAITMQQRAEERTAAARAKSARDNQQGVEAAERVRGISESIADNSVKAAQAVKRFREDLAKMKATNPDSEDYKNARDNQSAIEAGIRKKYMPAATAAAAAATRGLVAEEEKYENVLERVTAALNREINSQSMVDTQREYSRKMDAIAIEFLRTKTGLRKEDREELAKLVAMEVAGRDIQQAMAQSYDMATGAGRRFNDMLAAIEINLAKKRITAKDAALQTRALGNAYDAATDPLYELKRQVNDQLAVLGKFNDEREVELTLLELKRAAMERGLPLSELEAKWARDKVQSLIEQNRLQQISQSQINAGPNARRDRLAGFDAAAGNMKAGRISKGDAFGAVAQSSTIPDLYGGPMSEENLRMNEERHAAMFEELDRLRQLDLISVQSYANAKFQIERSANDASYQTATQFFDGLANLQKSKSKNMQKIGKAAAIAQATIDTYRAATGAYAAMAGIPIIGPALGIAAAAAAVASGIAQVQAIRSQPTGFMTGGYTGGGSRYAEAGVVHRREFVSNASTTADPGNRAVLESMQRGFKFSQAGGGSVGKARPMNIKIVRSGGVDVEVRQLSETDVEMIATRAINRQVPNVMAQEQRRPGSKFSKELARTTKTVRKLG